MPSPIPLTYAQKPFAGQVWELHRTGDGFELRDAGGELVTTVPAAEAGYRFRFPSFWASVTYLEILTPKDGAHYFKPDKVTVAAVKEQVDEVLGIDPGAAAKALRRKAAPALGGGLLAIAAGLALTAFTYLQAATQPGGGRYFVMTGLIGVGLFSTCRGLMWYARAGKLDRAARGA
ncbi:MAG TPA: hypothetical protein VH120_08800 [Gemmataceae bacterium]|jgi:hypothetical protein|nr:hypothetical protein [Gemmataceae bacterium]